MSMRGLIEATSVAVIGHRPAITSAHLKVAQHSRTTRQGGSRPASSATVTTAGCLRTRQSKSRHTDNGVPQLRPAVAITSRGRPVPSRSHHGGDCRGGPAGSPTSLHGGIRIPGCCGWHGSGGGVPVCRRRSDGPIPNMYDPYWAPPEKTLSAWAEGLAALAALALLVMFHLRTRKAAAPASKDRGSGWAAVSGCSSVMSRCRRCGSSGGTARNRAIEDLRRAARGRALDEQLSAVVPTSRGADMAEWGKADRCGTTDSD